MERIVVLEYEGGESFRVAGFAAEDRAVREVGVADGFEGGCCRGADDVEGDF